MGKKGQPPYKGRSRRELSQHRRQERQYGLTHAAAGSVPARDALDLELLMQLINYIAPAPRNVLEVLRNQTYKKNLSTVLKTTAVVSLTITLWTLKIAVFSTPSEARHTELHEAYQTGHSGTLDLCRNFDISSVALPNIYNVRWTSAYFITSFSSIIPVFIETVLAPLCGTSFSKFTTLSIQILSDIVVAMFLN